MPGLKRRKRKRVSPEPSSPVKSAEDAPQPVSASGPAPAKRRKVAAQRASSEATAAVSKGPLRSPPPKKQEEEITAASCTTDEDSEAEVIRDNYLTFSTRICKCLTTDMTVKLDFNVVK